MGEGRGHYKTRQICLNYQVKDATGYNLHTINANRVPTKKHKQSYLFIIVYYIYYSMPHTIYIDIRSVHNAG